MTLTRSAKLFTGLGLMAGLFWGCQDLLSQKDGSAKEPDSMASDGSALRLSIKDDSACREQWNAILDARTGGLTDTAAEKPFLANCVKEIKPGKNELPPIIPPHLQPDSISRCRWIVAQIQKGRNEMSVSFKRYCPGDCHDLKDKDSTRPVRFCRDPYGPGVDTTKPPRPEDSCRIYRARLAGLDSNSSQAANLRQYLLFRCGKPPIDTTKPQPPGDTCKIYLARLAGLDTTSAEYASLRMFLQLHCGNPPIDTVRPPDPMEDTCNMIRARLAGLDSTSAEAAKWRRILLERCGKPPIDTTKPWPPVDSCRIYRERLVGLSSNSAQAVSLRQSLFERCGNPPIDTVRPPDPMEDTCNMIRARLAGLDSTSAEAAKWRRILLERCGKPPIDTTRPPQDTIVKPPIPKDTLPKPIPLKPTRSCDKLRATLLKLNPASADYKRLVDAILAHCTEAKP